MGTAPATPGIFSDLVGRGVRDILKGSYPDAIRALGINPVRSAPVVGGGGRFSAIGVFSSAGPPSWEPLAGCTVQAVEGYPTLCPFTDGLHSVDARATVTDAGGVTLFGLSVSGPEAYSSEFAPFDELKANGSVHFQGLLTSSAGAAAAFGPLEGSGDWTATVYVVGSRS